MSDSLETDRSSHTTADAEEEAEKGGEGEVVITNVHVIYMNVCIVIRSMIFRFCTIYNIF